ncbi:hypothetical protein LV779_26695 [Streptomyces thinghirensis]|nr:hypothetical protein [Streptomyces thinghirensis]
MTDPAMDIATASAGESAVDAETLRERALATLVTARDRTTLLTSCVEGPDLTAQVSPLMSLLVWTRAHRQPGGAVAAARRRRAGGDTA